MPVQVMTCILYTYCSYINGLSLTIYVGSAMRGRYHSTRYWIAEMLLEPTEKCGETVKDLPSEAQTLVRDRHILMKRLVPRHV